jgi:hypothetical protein
MVSPQTGGTHIKMSKIIADAEARLLFFILTPFPIFFPPLMLYLLYVAKKPR